MLRMRIIVMTLLAVFCLGAVAASAASAALPEIVNKEGKELVNKKFSGKNTGSAEQVLETKAGKTIKCKTTSTTGEVKGTNEGEATFTFKECASTAFGAGKCQTGSTEGEIVTKISIKAVYLSRSKKELALLFSILPIPTGFVEIKCKTLLGTEVLKVYGTFLIPVKANTLSTKYTEEAKQEKGVQKPLEYENEAGEKVKNTLETEGVSGPEVFKKEQSGEEAKGEVTFEEEVEFKG